MLSPFAVEAWCRRRFLPLRWSSIHFLSSPATSHLLLRPASVWARHVYLCHAPAMEESEARRAHDKLNVTQMGGVASPFDPHGATEGRTLTNTCQTKLLGTTKMSTRVPLEEGQGWDHKEELGYTHKHTHKESQKWYRQLQITEFPPIFLPPSVLIKCVIATQCIIVLKAAYTQSFE